MHGTHPLVADHLSVLRQGLEVIERIDAETWTAPPGDLARHGAGAHFRHCHDYLGCFLAGLAEGRVDYDRRERDERFESDPLWAAARVRARLAELRAIGPIDPEREILVRVDAVAGAEGQWRRSTVGRELVFLSSHAIHHFALIAWTLRVHGVDPGEEFGVAPSTLRHWRETGALSPADR